MSKEITVEEALALPGAKIIDVRSESEYLEATIPEAVNIPLLTDEERAAVGTAYKKQGPDQARMMGLEYVSPRLPGMIKQLRELSEKGPLVVFCWRGGLRSKSVYSVLESLGLPVYRLIGGYKAYRRYVNSYLDRPLPHRIAVIHGLTGVGKTEVLGHLREIGAPAVDLEGLANNRGSVFGQIGLENQPSQKMFESLLVKELALWEDTGYIIVECESRRIGRVILPPSLSEAMKSGVKILTYCSIQERKERIKRIYSRDSLQNREELKRAIRSLGRRIGGKRAEEFCDMIDRGLLDEVVEYLLVNYYDPLYKYPAGPCTDYALCVDTTDPDRAAESVKEFLTGRFGK